MTVETNTLDLILDQWVSSLQSRDRSIKGYRSNFEDFLYSIKRAGADAKVAKEYLDKAIKAHMPSPFVKKASWNKNKAKASVTEKEYYASWENGIKQYATEVYFEVYPIVLPKEDDDGEPKVYGTMSAKEYKLQRKHAESFPILDTTKLEEEYKRRQALEFDFDNILGGEHDK